MCECGATVAHRHHDVVDIGEVHLVADETADVILTREVSPEIAAMIREVGAWQLGAVGVETAFSMLDARVVGYLTEFAGFRIRQINETTRRRIVLQLAEGIAEGEGTPALARRVRTVFKDASRSRSVAIAKTEVTTATNFARDNAYAQAGPEIVPAKEWLSTRDIRVRDTHRRLNGRRVLAHRAFEIDGMTARYPGDFALAAQNVNCRCTVLPVFPDVDGTVRLDAVTPFTQMSREFDRLQAKWDVRIERAFRRGFRMQEQLVLDQLEAVDRS